jgi:hypothetical protein
MAACGQGAGGDRLLIFRWPFCAQFEGGTPTAPENYLDLSYYQKALAGL